MAISGKGHQPVLAVAQPDGHGGTLGPGSVDVGG
eukprot:CAMPEP_0119320672 /NCGR_PEP_ID=MMETSP1333-20130426/53088_1 /TAXON_ID=418940 /ORGANISM="Scyphosphaera apsteinii, Strain RCC1455" /LENGTH=33 /DNA_ID= /DNA_START= /DNA_END= /DNA_ORIENTATION=